LRTLDWTKPNIPGRDGRGSGAPEWVYGLKEFLLFPDWSNRAGRGRRRVSFSGSPERQTFRFPMPLDYDAHDEAKRAKSVTQKKQKYILKRRAPARPLLNSCRALLKTAGHDPLASLDENVWRVGCDAGRHSGNESSAKPRPAANRAAQDGSRGSCFTSVPSPHESEGIQRGDKLNI
jgi:hypothetical protein